VPEEREAVRPGGGDMGRAELEERSSPPGAPAAWVRIMAEWAGIRRRRRSPHCHCWEIVKIGRQPGRETARPGDRPLSRHQGARPDPGVWRDRPARPTLRHGADVLQDHRGAPAQYRLPGIRYRHGKLSAQLDLRQAKDVETLKGLCARDRRVSAGYRPGTLGGRGLSPRKCANCAPASSTCHCARSAMSARGRAGRGFDTVVQNVSGITTARANCFPGAEPGPAFYPVSAIDLPDRLSDARSARWSPWPAARAKGAAGWCASRWRRPGGGWSAAARWPEAELNGVATNSPMPNWPWSDRERHPGRELDAFAPDRAAFRTGRTGPARGAARLHEPGVGRRGRPARQPARQAAR